MAEAVAKACTKCDVDVSAAKRHKDAKGRYWCEGCFAKAAAAQKVAQRDVVGVEESDAPATSATPAWLAGSLAVEGKRCTACSAPMPKTGVICTSCGHNAETGKALSTKVMKAPKEKAEKEGGGGGISAAVQGPALIALSAVGGVIGGGIGAAIYAMVTQATEFEFVYLVWIIGLCTGAGVAAVAKGYRGVITGVISVMIALVAFVGGRVWAISMIMDRVVEQVSKSEDAEPFTEEDVMISLADTVVAEWSAAGKALKWPAGMTVENAVEANDYPPEVWQEATARWGGMTQTQKGAYFKQMESRRVQAAKDYGTFALFFMTIGIFHIIGLVVVGAAAWKVGAG